MSGSVVMLLNMAKENHATRRTRCLWRSQVFQADLRPPARHPRLLRLPHRTRSERNLRRDQIKEDQNRTEDWIEETWCRKHEETRCMICQNVWRTSLKTSCKGKLQQQKQFGPRELKQGRHAHDTVVRLQDDRRELWTSPHLEAESRSAPVFVGQTFQKHTPKTRARYHHTYCRARNLEGQRRPPPITLFGQGKGQRVTVRMNATSESEQHPTSVVHVDT